MPRRHPALIANKRVIVYSEERMREERQSMRSGVSLFVALLLTVTVARVPLNAAAAQGSTACDSLASLALPDGTVTLARQIAAGAFTPTGGRDRGEEAFKDLPAFCRVVAKLTPSNDSEITIEVWLPLTGWNRKLQSVGNGAWAGTIEYPGMATALRAGYATASTDTGHSAGDRGFFAVGHPERVVDFAYRAVHAMTLAADSIIGGFYGTGPRLSYWNGCSTGGRQAMAEVQRYPSDYDGVLAGAIVNYPTHVQGSQLWAGLVAHRLEGGVLPAEKYQVLHDAVIRACDALDGVRDGVIENPAQCRFDPDTLACKDDDGPSCLTAPQLTVVKQIYAGPTNARGQSIYPGAAPGSELAWSARLAQPTALAIETYKYLVFKNANWDYHAFDIEKDVAIAEKVIGPAMDSIDPNLKPFFSRGGKLILYHGWNDPGVSPYNTVNYYKEVVEAVGGQAKSSESIRLFMIPGMGHCRGGDGTDEFGGVAALDQWRDAGNAPAVIVAWRSRDGSVDRTRPLCPYPQVATYVGKGSTDDASSFVCK
jgi:feruloyl esterase